MKSSSSALRKLFFYLLPGWGGLAWYAVLGTGIILFHVAVLSHDAGTVLPNLLGDDAPLWATAVTLTFVNPLDAVLNGNIAAIAGTALLWGLVGAMVYKGIDTVVSFFREAASTESEISVTETGNVVHHPLRRYFALRVGWHIVLGLAILVSLVLLIPTIRMLFGHDLPITQAATILELLRTFALSLTGWIVLFHWYVILIRLFRFFYLY